jgi:putative flippase GtrA
MTLKVRYAAFAVVATALNFAAQQGALALYRGPFDVPASIVAGTAVGFVVKYGLDKYFIFDERELEAGHMTRQVALYGLTAVASTLVFWAMEIVFWIATGDVPWKYFGGAIGISLGYVLKFLLDRRWVFQKTGPS